MRDQIKPLSKREDVVIQELPGELLIYDLSNDRAFCLNETSAYVWKHADGEKSVAELRRLMERDFKAAVREDLIWLALEQLGRDGLMETETAAEFVGVSRREVIRQIGLSSLIALPLIASLASPVHAVGCPFSNQVTPTQCSNNNPGCDTRTCTTGGTCNGGVCGGNVAEPTEPIRRLEKPREKPRVKPREKW